MLPHLQHIVDETEATQLLAQNLRLLHKAPIRLGVMSTVGHVRLARFLGQFENSYEGIELSVTEAPVADLRATRDFAHEHANQLRRDEPRTEIGLREPVQLRPKRFT